MSLPLYIHGASDVGRQRTQNEDSFRIVSRPEGGGQVLAVCDGMGGHEAGEVASQVASERIIEVLSTCALDHPPRDLYQTFVEANQAVLDAVRTRGGAQGMGTTGVVAWVLDSRCYVGWVGDSRLYYFRAGALTERTQDHTRVAQMVNQGLLRPEDASNHPDAHVLVRVLGGSAGVQRSFKPDVWTEPLELRTGDVVLLCSDGLYDLIEDHELYPLIEGRDYQDAVARLIQTANERGGVDNITVILLVAGQPEVPRRVEEPKPARRETLPDGMPGIAFPKLAAAPARTRSVVSMSTARLPTATASAARLQVPADGGRQLLVWGLLFLAVVALGAGFLLALHFALDDSSPSPASPMSLPAPPSSTPPAQGSGSGGGAR